MNRCLRTIQYLCVTCVLIALFCGTAAAQSVTDIIPAIKPPLFTVGVQTIARGMTAPNYAINAPGLSNYLFVVDQPGQLWRVNLQSLGKSVFLDVSSLLVPLGISSLGGYDERGFLGLAFHPDYATNGLFYTYTSEPVDGTADFTFPQVGMDCPGKPADLKPDHQNVVREWHVKNPTSINSRPDKTSRVVLRVDWGNFNHDGGMLAFGPGKMLFISLGDGGGEDDQTCQIGVDGSTTIGHASDGNGQAPGVAYGKIFRIDPLRRAGTMSKNRQYSIPRNNPFVGKAGFLPEIYVYGLRNTFRFNFDPSTGKMMGNDVGQNDIEEINVLSAGKNYGWRQKEAKFLFDPKQFVITGFDSDGGPTKYSPGSPASLTDPIAEYAHERLKQNQGHAGLGGFVYRGMAIKQLQGMYVFADYSQDFTDPIGRLLMVRKNTIYSLLPGTLSVFALGLGRDASGELYVTGNKTGIPSGKTGVVMRIVPAKR